MVDPKLPPPDSSPTPRLGWLRTLLPLLLVVGLWLSLPQLRAPSLPEQAPDIFLMSMDSEQTRLSDYRGQKVILNFWAPWCGPCRAETPVFSNFADDHPEIAVLGVAVDGSRDELAAAIEDWGIRYPVFRTDGAAQAAYDVRSIPLTVVVEPDGTISGVHAGIMLGPQLALLAR